MKLSRCCDTEPGDVAGVWSDLRSDERNLQSMGSEVACHSDGGYGFRFAMGSTKLPK